MQRGEQEGQIIYSIDLKAASETCHFESGDEREGCLTAARNFAPIRSSGGHQLDLKRGVDKFMENKSYQWQLATMPLFHLHCWWQVASECQLLGSQVGRVPWCSGPACRLNTWASGWLL